MSVRHNWKNVGLYEPDVSRIDAEVHELLLRLRAGLGRGFEVTGEAPAQNVSGGGLDGLIERFHQAQAMNNAVRKDFPQNQFVFEIYTGERSDAYKVMFGYRQRLSSDIPQTTKRAGWGQF